PTLSHIATLLKHFPPPLRPGVRPGDTIATMRPPPSPSLHRVIALLACASLAAGLGGCGSSHSVGAGSDPARVVPATAALYAGAIVHPSGSLQAGAQALGQTL